MSDNALKSIKVLIPICFLFLVLLWNTIGPVYTIGIVGFCTSVVGFLVIFAPESNDE